LIVQLALSKHPDLPDVPLVFDFIKPGLTGSGLNADEITTAWRIMLIQKAMGRPFAVGPGVPPERAKALRDAFMAVLRDPDFKSEAERAKNEVIAVDGNEMQAMLAQVGAAPQKVIDVLKTATNPTADEAVTGGKGAKP
jgi:hypothetical protein